MTKKNHHNIEGVITAMITPFDSNGAVDFNSLEKLTLHLINNGSNGLVVNGTTGECLITSEKEKIEIVLTVKKITENRLPIIANIDDVSTEKIIRKIKTYEELGIDTIMLVVPYYVKPTKAGIIEHYKTIAQNTSLNIILYENPARTASTIDSSMLEELTKEKNIIAVKDSSDGLSLIQETLSKTDKFSFLCGVDSLTIPFLATGAVGSISVTSHLIGKFLQDLHMDFDTMSSYQRKMKNIPLQRISNLLFSIPGNIAVKIILKKLGIIESDTVRAPFSLTGIDKNQYINNYFKLIKQYSL